MSNSSTYNVTRSWPHREEIKFRDLEMHECDKILGEFVGIYSLIGKVSVEYGRMEARDDRGNLITSIDWESNN